MKIRQWEIDMWKEQRAELRQAASLLGVRHDWHEPDCQGVTAVITGTHLDNAMGENQDSLPAINQEFVVHLKSEGSVIHKINLATLLALATIDETKLEA